MMNRYLLIVAASFAFSSTLLQPASGAGKSDYDAGLEAYAHKNYKLACEDFQKSVAGGNNSGIVLLYLGHSFLGLGDKVHALSTYRKLADNYASSAEGQLAMQCILRLDPSLAAKYKPTQATPSAAASAAATVAAAKTSASSSSNGLAPNVPVADPKKHFNERIVVVPPRGSHPAVSYATISTVRDIVVKLPRHIYKYLDDGGATINIAPNIEDKWPGSGDGKKPTVTDGTMGEEPGRTYGRDVHIYEREKVRGADTLKASRDQAEIAHTCYHELGHAIDDISGQLSKTPEFKSIVQQDISRMPEEVKMRESYFLEPSEAWAECTGVLLGAKDVEVAEYMPTVRSYIRNKFRL